MTDFLDRINRIYGIFPSGRIQAMFRTSFLIGKFLKVQGIAEDIGELGVDVAAFQCTEGLRQRLAEVGGADIGAGDVKPLPVRHVAALQGAKHTFKTPFRHWGIGRNINVSKRHHAPPFNIACATW